MNKILTEIASHNGWDARQPLAFKGYCPIQVCDRDFIYAFGDLHNKYTNMHSEFSNKFNQLQSAQNLQIDSLKANVEELKAIIQNNEKEINELKNINSSLKDVNEKLLENQKLLSSHITNLTATYQRVIYKILSVLHDNNMGCSDINDVVEINYPQLKLDIYNT